MIGVMVFDTLCTEGFDAGHGCTKIDERLAVVLDTGVVDEFGR
jgi:hypothetical protein